MELLTTVNWVSNVTSNRYYYGTQKDWNKTLYSEIHMCMNTIFIANAVKQGFKNGIIEGEFLRDTVMLKYHKNVDYYIDDIKEIDYIDQFKIDNLMREDQIELSEGNFCAKINFITKVKY
ncbi:MAG: hypothetical protein HC836_28110 [Richelia sp. RM2_1_2]|nr:hypothetical protein [Richelia sp. RM2_1_2]